MTDTERKALALLNEAFSEHTKTLQSRIDRPSNPYDEALCRAIEQHEAFRQEVSDAVENYNLGWRNGTPSRAYYNEVFARFIIAKPDPLVEALDEALWEVSNVKLTDRELRAVSLRLNAKRGGKIVWGEG